MGSLRGNLAVSLPIEGVRDLDVDPQVCDSRQGPDGSQEVLS